MNQPHFEQMNDIAPAQATEAANQTANASRVLSAEEIAAVAGGPEGSVGTGMNPP